MLGHRTAWVLIIVIVFICHGLAAAALPEQLKQLNFSLYSAPWPANDMPLRDLQGRSLTLSSLRGKVVLLNFWKIDCPPCSVEKPILERIFRKYASRGLEVVAVNLVDECDQQQSYCRAGGFSFKFAFDPDNRLSLQKQILGSGASTSFVVNSRQEAIYEIPGVPTTYVIDRDGRILGNAVGLVNWEQPVLSQFLESLLGPPVRAIAENPQDLRNTPTPNPVSLAGSGNPGTAPNWKTNLDHGSEGSTVAYSPKSADAPSPVQGPARNQQPAMLAQAVPQAPAAVTDSGPSQSLVHPRPSTSSKATVGKKKSGPARSAGSTTTPRQPKPYSPTPGQVAQPLPGSTTPPGTKPVTVPPQPVSPVAPSGASPGTPPATTLPPLPPAMPYSPSRIIGGQPSPVPDSTGSVWARIPGSPVAVQGTPSGSPGGGTGLPSAQPLRPRDPITGFILDSFGGTRPSRVPQQPPVEPQTPAPASSFLGQLGQDFQQLGSGIMDAVSRIAPSR